MTYLNNPYRGPGLDVQILRDIPAPSTNANAVQTLLDRCPDAGPTPTVKSEELAQDMGVGEVIIKDERQRMGLGSFKALGAAYVIAHAACVDKADVSQITYASSTAGNHGLSIAAGAKAFGAKAAIYISETVPEAFAVRLRDLGATVVRRGDDYTASLNAAMEDAKANGWTILSDTSWPGYTEIPHRLMEGYTAFMAEAETQMDRAPTHIFLQAGVGGLAGAAAAMARKIWGDAPHITVVEPDMAPALFECIKAGDFVTTTGGDSCMGRLDCKEASLIALKGLARDADGFMLISEDEGKAGAQAAAKYNMPSTPSGAGGLAGALVANASELGMDANSRVMIILSEGPE